MLVSSIDFRAREGTFSEKERCAQVPETNLLAGGFSGQLTTPLSSLNAQNQQDRRAVEIEGDLSVMFICKVRRAAFQRSPT